MQHIKYIGHDFDENGFLVETFEYKGCQYSWIHNGKYTGSSEGFHQRETQKIDSLKLAQ